jgi:hypothetical protein
VIKRLGNLAIAKDMESKLVVGFAKERFSDAATRFSDLYRKYSEHKSQMQDTDHGGSSSLPDVSTDGGGTIGQELSAELKEMESTIPSIVAQLEALS